MRILSFLAFVIFMPGFWSSGIKNACKFSIDDTPVVRIDDHLQGIWIMKEDTDAHNYLIVEKDGNFQYSITYMNRGGTNRGLEHSMFFFSEINNVKFINIPNWDDQYPGYLLLKINDISRGSWAMSANLVTDPSITTVKSRQELRKLLEKNINNPAFYGKEIHFYKAFEFNSFH